ncbi:syntaxin-related protein KNOLLE, partial [Tanacetum coccineum]
EAADVAVVVVVEAHTGYQMVEIAVNEDRQQQNLLDVSGALYYDVLFLGAINTNSMQPIVAVREQLFIMKGLQRCTRLYLMHSLRRYFTVTGKQPDDEVIENIINHDGEEYLSKAIQIHDRYDAAKKIETSLLELHQVFLDMAVMVDAQGKKDGRC